MPYRRLTYVSGTRFSNARNRRLRSQCLPRTFTPSGGTSRRYCYLRAGKGSKRFWQVCDLVSKTLTILTFRQIFYDVVRSIFIDNDSLHTSRANVRGEPGPERRCSGGRADKRNAAFRKTKTNGRRRRTKPRRSDGIRLRRE